MDRRAALREQVLHNQGRLLACTRLPEAHGFMALELTMPQFKTLVLLDAKESAVVGQLARGLGVGLSTMTGIVDRLVDQGLVARGEDPDDRRATRVRLTPLGRATIERFHQIRRRAFSQILERLGDEELELAMRATEVLANAAEGLWREASRAESTGLVGTGR